MSLPSDVPDGPGFGLTKLFSLIGMNFRPQERQDENTLNEYRDAREKLQSPTCASQSRPDAEYPKVIPIDSLIAMPLSTVSEQNPLVARVPSDVWRIVIELLKRVQLPPTALITSSDNETSKLLQKFESEWGGALRSRACILSLLQSCRAVYLKTRALFSNQVENYLSLVKGYYNFEQMVVSYNRNFAHFPFVFCCALEDDGVSRGSMQIFDREKKVEFDSYDLQPHFAPTLADNHEETIRQGTSNIRRPGEILVGDLLPRGPKIKQQVLTPHMVNPKLTEKERRKGWSLHHITVRVFAKHDSLIASGATVHERSKFLFSDYATTDGKTQRIPFFEMNLFVDRFGEDEVDYSVPLNASDPDHLMNNGKNFENFDDAKKLQRLRTTDSTEGEKLIVKLLTPREFYEKQESHPTRVQQRDLEEQFRDEYTHLSRHSSYIEDTSDPAKDIQSKFGNSVVKVAASRFDEKFLATEPENLIIHPEVCHGVD